MAQPILKSIPVPAPKKPLILRKPGEAGKTNWPKAMPKQVLLRPLKELHPAHAMDRRNCKAYLAVLIGVLPTELDEDVLRKAYVPTVYRLPLLTGSKLDGSFWKLRQLSRARDLAKQQREEMVEIENETYSCRASFAFATYKSEQCIKNNNDVALTTSLTGGAWLSGKPKKAILFLDCACVLRDTLRPDIDSLIDDVVEELEIAPAIVALVKAYIAGPNDGSHYHKVCSDITALVKPAPKKKKAAVKKVAAKKIITPLPACGYHKTTGKLRQC